MTLIGGTVPKYVFFTTSFPKTASGKIQRFKLKDQATELLQQGKGACGVYGGSRLC